MKADEIFFFAFVVILSPQKFSTLPTTKRGFFLGLVTENEFVLCEMGLEVLGQTSATYGTRAKRSTRNDFQ
jgi:hypothetical protein